MQETTTNHTQAVQSLPSRRRRFALVLIFAVVFLALAGTGMWWWQAQAYESTDDAFIAGHVNSVSPQVAGRVIEVLVADNQKVAAGQTLFRLDADSLRAKFDLAKASLDEAEQKLQESRSLHKASLAAVEQAKADAAASSAQTSNAASDLARYNRLIGSGAVSQQARDTADTLSRTTSAALQAAQKRVLASEAQAAVSATQIHTAEAGVEKCRASLQQARLDLAYTEVKASAAGRVTNKSVEPGDYLQVGQVTMNLVGDDVWVVANFKETQLKHLRPGQQVTITVDAYPDHVFKAHVDSVQAGTGAAFSLLPPQNASGNYVKVVQRVPVKIMFDADQDVSKFMLATGMSVIPQVRVR